MGRTKDSKNKKFYHYKVIKYDDNQEILDENFYLNLDNAVNDLNCSRRLATYHLKKANIEKKGKLKNIKIQRIKEPINYEIIW